jgi:cell division transport system permease protein
MGMKIRTVRYIIKEGMVNTYRNMLMTLASVGTVTAALLIFGVFFLIAVNLNHNTAVLKEQPEMVVYCETELDEVQVAMVEQAIRQNDLIEAFKKVDRKEAFENFKKMLEDNVQMLEGYDESIMPVSFNVELKDPKNSVEVINQLGVVTGVESVRYSKATIDFIDRITNWVRLITIALTIVLLAISMFIISNTIKLTVFARRKEINIMKYIGATDWFIRWPFFIEGVIIGFAGALVAFIFTSYGYNMLESKFNQDLVNVSIDFITLIKLNVIGLEILLYYSIIGIVVGAFGSFVSIRKYLHV